MRYGLLFVCPVFLCAEIGFSTYFGTTISGIRRYIHEVKDLHGNAYGIHANGGITLQSALGLGRGVLRVDIIDAQTNAYGFYNKPRKSQMQHYVNGGKFSFGTILARTENAYGIYNQGNVKFIMKENFSSDDKPELLIENIKSSQKNAYGVYQESGIGEFYATLARIDLGSIQAQQNAYGFSAQNGSEIRINLNQSTLSFKLDSKQQTQAFGGEGKISVALEESSVYFSGDGGKIDVLSVKNSSYNTLAISTLAFSGSSPKTRTLKINSLQSQDPNNALVFGLSINPQMGIADQILIESIPYQNRAIRVDIILNYDSSWNPNQKNSQNQKLTVLKYKGDGELEMPKSSVSTMGFSEIETQLFIQDIQGGYRELYVDLAQKPKIGIANSQIHSSFLSSAGIYGGYFGLLDSLNQRLGELKTNPNSSGLWLKMGFGGEAFSPFSYEMHSFMFHMGGDFSKHFLKSKHFLGASFSYLTSLSDNLSFNHVEGFKGTLYHTMILDNRFYMDTQVNVNFMHTNAYPSNSFSPFEVKNIFFGITEEVGMRFGNLGWGFYFEPSAMLHLGYVGPTRYQRTHSQDTLQVKGGENNWLLYSRLGGKVGIDIASSKRSIADLYLGFFASFEHLPSTTYFFENSYIQEKMRLKAMNAFGFVFVCGANFDISKHFKLYGDIEAGGYSAFYDIYQVNLGLRFNF